MITLKMGIQNKQTEKRSKLMDSENRLVVDRGRDQE